MCTQGVSTVLYIWILFYFKVFPKLLLFFCFLFYIFPSAVMPLCSELVFPCGCKEEEDHKLYLLQAPEE